MNSYIVADDRCFRNKRRLVDARPFGVSWRTVESNDFRERLTWMFDHDVSFITAREIGGNNDGSNRRVLNFFQQFGVISECNIGWRRRIERRGVRYLLGRIANQLAVYQIREML